MLLWQGTPGSPDAQYGNMEVGGHGYAPCFTSAAGAGRQRLEPRARGGLRPGHRADPLPRPLRAVAQPARRPAAASACPGRTCAGSRSAWTCCPPDRCRSANPRSSSRSSTPCCAQAAHRTAGGTGAAPGLGAARARRAVPGHRRRAVRRLARPAWSRCALMMQQAVAGGAGRAGRLHGGDGRPVRPGGAVDAGIGRRSSSATAAAAGPNPTPPQRGPPAHRPLAGAARPPVPVRVSKGLRVRPPLPTRGPERGGCPAPAGPCGSAGG